MDTLIARLGPINPKDANSEAIDDTEVSAKYLSRLLSLHLSDLTTTEPQSLSQANHSNHVSLQALSSRSHKTTITSATHLSTLSSALPSLNRSVTEVREAIPALDESAVTFASTYARSRDNPIENPTLQARKDSSLLARQSDKLTDILDLPSLLSTAIASAGSGVAGSANYSQALDLFAHIRRLGIIYPDSALVRSVQADAELAMKSMTTNLLSSLRSQNIRLAAAIRTIGWLRRVVPELANQPQPLTTSTAVTTDKSSSSTMSNLSTIESAQSEGSFGALFLVSRLHTFLVTTEALSPLRDLADQETERRLATTGSDKPGTTTGSSTSTSTSTSTLNPPQSQTQRRPSSTTATHGTQTERYLKRYIEIFREQSFSTVSMYRNIFPSSSSSTAHTSPLSPPSALQQFPLHLVEIFMDVLRTYLPNISDPAARESLLMQVLYAANSLGRLGADFSMMISLLFDEVEVEDGVRDEAESKMAEEGGEVGGDGKGKKEKEAREPEWARVIKKHRVQATRLDALAMGQDQGSGISVR